MNVRLIKDYNFIWLSNPLYLINCLIEATVVAFSLFLLLKFYSWDLHKYNIQDKNLIQNKSKFDHQKWSN